MKDAPNNRVWIFRKNGIVILWLTAVLLRVQIFWDVMLCGWLSTSPTFQRTLMPSLTSFENSNIILILQIDPWEWRPRNLRNVGNHSSKTPFSLCYTLFIDRDSSVGTGTRCEMEGPGFESWSKRDFPHLPRPALKLTQPSIQWVPSLFLWGKAAGAWR